MVSFLLYTLIVVVITSSLVYSDGAWGIMEKIRSNKYIKSLGILDCFLCTSFWVSLPFTFFFAGYTGYFTGFILALGVWGLSYVIDMLINK